MIKAPDFIADFSLNHWKPLNIVVVGAGGTGSALLNKLFQMHTTLKNLDTEGFSLTVYDDDIVSPSNIGRQAFWQSDISLFKADVLVKRYNQFGNTNWKAENKRFDAQIHINQDTVIFGCVDSVSGRIAMHETMNKKHNIVWIDSGNDNRSANVFMGMKANVDKKERYLPSVYDLFKSQMDTPVAAPEPSCSTAEAIFKQDYGINDFAAAQAAQMLWQMIRHGSVAYQGVTLDLSTGTTTPIAADPDIWSMFGYAPDKKVA